MNGDNAHFGAPCGYIGQGGTIPLMSMLQKGFPQAQMMVCGVLGPKSNAHGPNEFLHVGYGKKLTAAVAQGYFFMKIKIGQPGTQAEMLEKDKARLSAIHAATTLFLRPRYRSRTVWASRTDCAGWRGPGTACRR